jgi:tetratricopeptide (TPR) repeat protein
MQIKYNRTIEDVAETLKNAKDRGERCSLLIGAGCSVDAGIPTAQGFVDQIKIKHPLAYQRAPEKTYPQCMAELMISERRALIAEYVDKAKINWAHIGIARLIQEGLVDRILTTNFDPLIVRACALLGEFPAVYDFAASRLFNAADVADKAVFHLHGQRTGFVIMNTDEECKKHSQYMAPIFDDAGRRRLWIVVGYSGENDPVFQHLANIDRFASGLYWVGYRDQEPPLHVREKLLNGDKDAYYVPGHDADSFFIRLTQRLGHFPPALVQKPFSYLDGIMSKLAQFRIPDQTPTLNVLSQTRSWIKAAKEEYEDAVPVTKARHKPSHFKISDHKNIDAETTRLLMAGQYASVIKLTKGMETVNISAKLKENLVWAHVMLGVQAGNTAKNIKISDSKTKKTRALKNISEHFKAALAIDPKNIAALNNWAIALTELARAEAGNDARQLYDEAFSHFKSANKIDVRDGAVLVNWARALAELAKRKTDDEASELETTESAEDLYLEALKKYKAAYGVNPEDLAVLNGWGIALALLAERKTGTEQDALYSEAFKKFRSALKIKPNESGVISNWGNGLSKYAKTKVGAEAERLHVAAINKYKIAVKKAKTVAPSLLNGLAGVLINYANTKDGEDQDRLYADAFENYEAALKIKPDDAIIWYNWAVDLCQLGGRKDGAQADDLFQRGVEKFNEALKIQPDMTDGMDALCSSLIVWAKKNGGTRAAALFAEAEEKLLECNRMVEGKGSYNLACIKALQGDLDACKGWLEHARLKKNLPIASYIEADEDFVSVRETVWFKQLVSN